MKTNYFIWYFILALMQVFTFSEFELQAQEQAKPADAFVESIGIGDRFDWLNDDGLLNNAQTALSNLKIRHIRVGIAAESGSSTYISNTKNMASALGVKLCILTETYNTWSTQQAWLNTWRAYSGTIAVEGPNEVGSSTSVASIQQSLWNYAHPLGMEVYAWTLGGQAGYYRTEGISNGGATVDNYCDYLNFHPYHWYTYNYNACKMNGLWQNGDFDGLGYGTSGCINQVRTMAGNQSKPFVCTEFGWCINGLEQGVSINYAKKYVIRNCFENFNSGMHRGYIFSLTDYAGAGANYALANSNNGSLNATGQTVANTILILEEPGKNNISTSSLTYSLSNISSTGGNSALLFADDKNMQNDEIHHSLLQKSNGVFYLVLWSDYDSHNGEDGWAQNATLNLPAGASSVKVYIPMNGTGVVKDYGAVATGGSVALNSTNGTAIPDHPIIVAITSGGGGSSSSKLTGTVIGTTGSWNNSGNTRDKAFDGNISTFFDAPTADGNWTGLSFGSNKQITSIKFVPRSGLESRMNGGKFQASSNANFTSGVVTLYTISGNPAAGWNTINVSNTNGYRYVRYLSPNGGYGNVAEIEFYGSAKSTNDTEETTNISNNANAQTLIYPNPTNNVLHIANIDANAQISIYSIEGKLISSSIAGNTNVNFNVTNWNKGLYIININSNTNNIIHKVLVK